MHWLSDLLRWLSGNAGESRVNTIPVPPPVRSSGTPSAAGKAPHKQERKRKTAAQKAAAPRAAEPVFREVEVEGAPAGGQAIPRRQTAPEPAPAPREEAAPAAPAEYTPYLSANPSYKAMNLRQKAWYKAWREEVQQGRYPDNDLSYIYVYCQELLGAEARSHAPESYMRLRALWQAYRGAYPILDRDLTEWSFCLCRDCGLPFLFPEDPGIDLSRMQEGILNAMIDSYVQQSPAKLPFPLLRLLGDYPVTESRFYGDGHEALMAQALPRCLALCDAYLRRHRNKGFFALYGPARTRKQYFYAYQGAQCPGADKRIPISVPGYLSHKKLRATVDEVLRYGENTLRKLYDFRGRLRKLELEAELAAVLEAFLKAEYAPEALRKAERDARGVQLDAELLQDLRAQSDAVREALEVEESELPAVEDIPILFPVVEEAPGEEEADSPQTENAPQAQASAPALFDTAQLSPDMAAVLEALDEIHLRALAIIAGGRELSPRLEALASEAFLLPEMLPDGINEAAMAELDDILIDTSGEEPRILEQYETELRAALCKEA